MCGIFAVVNDREKKAAQTTLEGLKRLEYRGYDSWGIAVVEAESRKVFIDKHVGKIGQAQTDLPRGALSIGHTRWATHGGVTDDNAHPHQDCSGRIVVIHNGIVENYQELKGVLIKKGHRFKSETDTEVIAHLIEERVKRERIEKAVFSVFGRLSGSNAVGVLDAQTLSIVACRNGSPLVAGVGDNQYFLASDVTPFLQYTRDAVFLNDGEAVSLNAFGITLFDIGTGRKKKINISHVDWKTKDVEKEGYPHYLLKEIMEQAVTIPRTASINNKLLLKIANIVNKSKRVVLTGCGTASYCALAAKHFFAQSGIEAQTYGAYEFDPFSCFLDKGSVVFAISQSGETADTLLAAKRAKLRKAFVIAVVNARGSTLERLSDAVLPVGAGPEIAVVSTKAFTAQLATLYLVGKAIKGRLKDGVGEISNLGRALTKWLSRSRCESIRSLSKRLLDEEDIYLIGKHLQYCASLEFALKIKESSYIHAEPFAAGELKHGVITLIQKDTPCIVLGEASARLEILSSSAELKARGGAIIGVAPFKSDEFDYHIETPEVGNLTVVPNVIVGQLLGYYLGVGRGVDPDKPRNLAKSVTVK